MKITLREITSQNTGTEKLYSSVGFERTGKISEDGEVVMKFSL